MIGYFQKIDASVVVAILALIGTIITVIGNRWAKKQDTIIATNKQLMEMFKASQEEIRLLKEQHAKESERLENKIVQLTAENQALKDEVYKLNNYIVEKDRPSK